ncbi:MAG: tRNA pseudouridine(38-40) synthase TruA [Rhodobacteraceae bacterium]|nr:tRNA pseudouridine(38-40) synthase TruA [Paracoccaceae bacterium]MCY4250577.1 tRNA pseudouridine(38-40) synthase TruA [Paracoccaceae bacterium]MCY4306811.1 tRNA pseudouridine(38-40) synthase TruA [Paracoccaceae bacterium]
MPRFAMLVEYNGEAYCGWQRQKAQSSVQETIENAIRKLEGDLPHITAAGRTDTGVHALGQVIHFDLKKDWLPQTLIAAINANLRPSRIAVLKASEVAEDFHARFSAVKRTYLYRVIVRSSPLVFESGLAFQIYKDLDLADMIKGASHLMGKHDFTTFRSAHCQALSPVKTMNNIQIDNILSPSGKEYEFILEAPSFLHKQVRSIVGTLIKVGMKNLDPDDVKTILEARNRQECGPLAPPKGLYLKKVTYDHDPFSGIAKSK